jgi:hypothetical protein
MQKKWTCSSLVLLHLPRAAFFLASRLPLENFTAFIYHARSQPTVTHHYYFFPTCKLPGRDSFAVLSLSMPSACTFGRKKFSTNFFLISAIASIFMKAVEICKSRLSLIVTKVFDDSLFVCRFWRAIPWHTPPRDWFPRNFLLFQKGPYC